MENKFPIQALLAITIIAVALLCSGCVSEVNNVTAIEMNGEGYQFNTNLLDSVNYPVNNAEGIKNMLDNAESVCIVFDESSEEDNAYFAVVSYNTVFKLTRYYTILGSSVGFSGCNGYNLTGLDIPVIVLKGPNTGAAGNSITLDSNEIILQGTDALNLQMAGDKLVLVAFGIENIQKPETKGITNEDIITWSVGIVLLIGIIYLAYRELGARKPAEKGQEKSDDKE